MGDRFLHSFNLNLLRTLRVLLRVRSISRAARELGLTQPAVSAALARLRVALGDPLLVQVGRTMELTRRGVELFEPVEEICFAIEKLSRLEVLEPFNLDRHFIIATTDYFASAITAPLLQALEAAAPNVSLQFVDMISNKELTHPLEDIDFFVMPDWAVKEAPFQALSCLPLFDEKFVAVMRRDHALALEPTPLANDPRWANARYALYSLGLAPDATALSKDMTALAPGKIILYSQQFMLLPFVASSVDCVAIVPSRLAIWLSGLLDIHIVDPLPDAGRMNIVLAWDKRHEADTKHHWLRDLIKSVASTPFLALPAC